MLGPFPIHLPWWRLVSLLHRAAILWEHLLAHSTCSLADACCLAWWLLHTVFFCLLLSPQGCGAGGCGQQGAEAHVTATLSAMLLVQIYAGKHKSIFQVSGLISAEHGQTYTYLCLDLCWWYLGSSEKHSAYFTHFLVKLFGRSWVFVVAQDCLLLAVEVFLHMCTCISRRFIPALATLHQNCFLS